MINQVFGHFEESDTEQRYQEKAKKNIRFVIQFCLTFFVLNSIFLIFSDLYILHYSIDNTVVISRLFYTAGSIFILLSLRYIKSPKVFNIYIFSFFIMTSYINYIVHLNNPKPEDFTYTIELFIILSFYLIFPIKLYLQAIGSFIYTLTLYASLSKGALGQNFFYQIIVLLITANVIGYFISRYMNIISRNLFLRLQNNIKIRTDLESTINDIKVIEGIIPICASCKKIRNDKGFWNEFDFHFSEITHAEFIDKTCPKCNDGGQL